MQRLLAVLAVVIAPPALADERPLSASWVRSSQLCVTSSKCPAKEAYSLEVATAAVRAEGHVFKIGDGHYLAFAVERNPGDSGSGWVAMFYGDASALYRMPHDSDLAQGTPSDGWLEGSTDSNVSFGFNDARHDLPIITLHRTREITVRCGARSFQTKELANGRALLAKAKLLAPLRKERAPFRLARGEGTTYYYTDVEAGDSLGRSPQLYVGKRGAMKRVKLVDYASDRAGQVFVTAIGTLHIDSDVRTGAVRMSWTAPGKAPMALREVPPDRELVFGDLGVYDGQRWNTPCDDLPLR